MGRHRVPTYKIRAAKSARLLLHALYGGPACIRRTGRQVVIDTVEFRNSYNLYTNKAALQLVSTLEASGLIEDFTWDELFIYFKIVLPEGIIVKEERDGWFNE
jgi:hypothetical protein